MINKPQSGNRAAGMAEFAGVVARHLQVIYKTNFSEGLVNRILAMANLHYKGKFGWNEKDIVLITYGNTILSAAEKPLRTLSRFADRYLADTFNTIHMLPFFPYTSDDGFAVSDFMEVDANLGTWDDFAAFSGYTLMADLVINHVSSAHPWFQNYLQNRDPGRGYFIEAQPGADYSNVIRPRSTPLFTRYETADGPRDVWTTFSADQIDLNFPNPEVLLEMIRILIFYISRGIRIIRLDAIAFVWKVPGTTSLHLPETHEIVKLFRDIATWVCPGTVILTETNVPNRENWSYFGNHDEAHMVYQFSLPPLLLHALHTGNAGYLSRWAQEIPETPEDQTYLNYTASHDGIGVRPLEGLLPAAEIEKLITAMTGFGGMVSRKTNADGSQSPYEINITYLDAMKGSQLGPDHLQEERFVTSQAVMVAFRGIPAFYIHSLLGTPNDNAGVKATGRARSINRRQLSEEEISGLMASDTMQRRLFERLTHLIRVRRNCPAFHPDCSQEVLEQGSSVFAFVRINRNRGLKVFCLSNISVHPVEIRSLLPAKRKGCDLISGEQITSEGPILLKACQTKWIAVQD
ncbi:MAG: sugar phosphorylase [Bacteroidales bacterium]|nr:sugar phosphorylase [Bacteroidales bacterium]